MAQSLTAADDILAGHFAERWQVFPASFFVPSQSIDPGGGRSGPDCKLACRKNSLKCFDSSTTSTLYNFKIYLARTRVSVSMVFAHSLTNSSQSVKDDSTSRNWSHNSVETTTYRFALIHVTIRV